MLAWLFLIKFLVRKKMGKHLGNFLLDTPQQTARNRLYTQTQTVQEMVPLKSFFVILIGCGGVTSRTLFGFWCFH